jgi:hypothetical protein
MTEIELHHPSIEFFVAPDGEHFQHVRVSRYEGKLYVRGSYGGVSMQAMKLAEIAYLAMERAFLKLNVGRDRSIKKPKVVS